MMGGECADDQIEGLFLDASQPISAHARTIQTAGISSAPDCQGPQSGFRPHVAKLNELYALVIVGDNSAVLKTTNDGIDR
jgi:hypothetical protein